MFLVLYPFTVSGTALHLEHRPRADQNQTCRLASSAVLPADLTLDWAPAR